jgi:hypothetical protein
MKKKGRLKFMIIKEAAAAGGKLTYQLIRSEEIGIPVYGIKIVSSIFGRKEETVISDITCEFDHGQALFELCRSYTVLPCCLNEIATDFITSEAIYA